MMDELKCKNCGAPLESNGHCSYCGSRFRIERSIGELKPTLIEVEHPRVRKVVAETAYDEFVAHQIGDEVGEIARKQIAHSMADALTEAIKYSVNYDQRNMRVIVRGELRVIEPDFRF